MKNILPFLIIAVCAGMYYLYIDPISLEVKSLSLKKAEYEDVLIKSEEIKQKRKQILDDYSSISEEDKARLDKFVPAVIDPVVFLNDINTTANRYSLKVRDFTIDQGTIVNQGGDAGSAYKVSTVTFTALGDYEQFKKFLADLEESLNLVDVVDLAIRQDSSSTGSGNNVVVTNSYSYSLKIHTYSLK